MSYRAGGLGPDTLGAFPSLLRRAAPAPRAVAPASLLPSALRSLARPRPVAAPTGRGIRPRLRPPLNVAPPGMDLPMAPMLPPAPPSPTPIALDSAMDVESSATEQLGPDSAPDAGADESPLVPDGDTTSVSPQGSLPPLAWAAIIVGGLLFLKGR